MQSWITQSEDQLALDVYPDLYQMYIHTQLDETIVCFHTLDKITFLIFTSINKVPVNSSCPSHNPPKTLRYHGWPIFEEMGRIAEMCNNCNNTPNYSS